MVDEDAGAADPPQPSADIREAFRAFLLPVPADREQAAIRMTSDLLGAQGVEEVDQAGWLRLRMDDWRQSGEAGTDLQAVVSGVLESHVPEVGPVLARRGKYFSVHRSLVGEHLLLHEEASAFLTHALLIGRFGRDEFMSAAQVTKLLAARDSRLTFSWRSVRQVLRALGLGKPLKLSSVKKLVADDLALEELFADADVEVAAQMVGDVAERLGFPGPFAEHLIRLCDRNLTPFEPYLKILHYQCIIAAFFDHAVTNAYEFSPRGNVVTWLCSQYPDALNGAGNPFLNNAKAVQSLDMAWAEGRSERTREARALSRILTGMEAMGFAARRELAEWVRRWLHRIMRFHAERGFLLPDGLTPDQVRQVLDGVAASESGTRGVVEQRIVDALTSLRYTAPEWRSRGLGDSVNAANIATRKLGDCDYQCSARLQIQAFESHGGRLTDVYLDEHLRSLRKTLRLRIGELRGVAEPEQWQVSVAFVAQSIQAEDRPPITVEGVPVTIRLMTMADMVAEYAPAVDEGVLRAFETHVHARLNELRTPTEFRERYSKLAGLA